VFDKDPQAIAVAHGAGAHDARFCEVRHQGFKTWASCRRPAPTAS
jgi:hypothetical protein